MPGEALWCAWLHVEVMRKCQTHTLIPLAWLAGRREPSLRPCSPTQPVLSHLSDPEQLWAVESSSRDSRPELSPKHLPTHSAVHEGAKDADSDPLT